MPTTDKIKRSLIWIRKSLRIIERTTAPGELSGLIRPTIDALGWERRSEATATFASATGTTQVTFPAQADDVFRLITEVSVEHFDIANALNLWITLQTNAVEVGILAPVAIPASTINIPSGLNKPFLMIPGDILRGKCEPATGVGITLRIKARFVDINIGEYIAPT